MVVTEIFQGHKHGAIPSGHCITLQVVEAGSVTYLSLLLSPFVALFVCTDLNVCPPFLFVGQCAVGRAGLLSRLGNSNDQWGEWTAPKPSLRVTEAEGSRG